MKRGLKQVEGNDPKNGENSNVSHPKYLQQLANYFVNVTLIVTLFLLLIY